MKPVRHLAAVVTALVTLFALYRFCFVPYSVNKLTKRYEAATAAALGGNRGASMFVRSELPRVMRAMKQTPENADLHVLAGINLTQDGRYSEAIEIFTAALRYDQRPEIYFNLGTALMRLGREVEGLENLVKATKFNVSMIDRIKDPELRKRVISRLPRINVVW